jgi:hypothetical protein
LSRFANPAREQASAIAGHGDHDPLLSRAVMADHAIWPQ